ncbi:GatB/YqeY domain-containing protein [Hypoxylon rubiginosum]|uniref:GatB/YqeY domain-containing protein n=1 Tax=Hypoxylon rubiginosum TaxID=110542 RepID=A0ACB9Z785_9PEZI|nr:GatB/YqeY domain-containing protein [Hypoxylon rubiginosum]
MATSGSSSRVAQRLLRARFTSPTTPSSSRTCPRFYSSDAPPPAPPLLQKIKADLKTAMRAKDAARLTAIRSILAASLNASKTASPIATDAQVVALLRRTQRASADASAEFAAASRQDLVDKEQAQIGILEEYAAASGVEELDEEQLRAVVAGVVTALTSEGGGGDGKVRMGDVMKKLLAPGGPLEGKDVERALLARIVKEVTGSS